MAETKYNLQVFKSPTLLCEGAAKFIVDLANKTIGERGKFVIALSGGNTPQQLFTLLSSPPYVYALPWEKIFIFWGDERWVPLDDKDNNAYVAKSILLDKINIPATNIHRMQVNLPPAVAAYEYEKELKEFFVGEPPRFDLILLGLGTNGHTASLFPGTIILNEQEPVIDEVYVEELKMFRITMSAPLINLARHILFLITGKEKNEVLTTILTGVYQPNKFPAQLIKPVDGKLEWFADEAAAAGL